MSKILKKIIMFIVFVFVFLIIVVLFFPRNYENPSIKKENDIIRIMSYNIKNSYQDVNNFEERKHKIVELIIKYKPDSIGLQEADPIWIEYLKTNLKWYSFVWVGREDWLNRWEYVPIFYLKDKYELIDSETNWLSLSPSIPSIWWDASIYRIYTKIVLKNRKSWELYSHYNTHLDHKWKQARVKWLQSIINQIKIDNNKSILTWDFNFLEWFSESNNIDSSIVDTKNIAKNSFSFWTINYFLNLNFKFFPPIDFIFIKKWDFKVKQYSVIQNAMYNGKQISDHYAIMSDIY